MGELVLPGRYYQRYPYANPPGLKYEEQRLDVDKTAYMLVDVYGLGFSEGDPEPKLATWQREPWHQHRDMIRHRIRPALDAAREAGLKVVYVTNYSPRIADNESEFGKVCLRVEHENGLPIEEFYAEGSPNLAFSSIIAPRPDDYHVHKQMYDGFFETPLDSLLRNLGIKNCVCVGFAADICLLTTMIGGMYRNYRMVLLRDCAQGFEFIDTAPDMRMTWFGVRYVEALVGFTCTSTEFIEACHRVAAEEAGNRR